MAKTKIVATLGRVSENREIITSLVKAGVDVFRLNSKHGTLEEHKGRIHLIREVGEALKITIGILIDLQGPEVRIKTPNGKDFSLNAGEKVLLVDKPVSEKKYILVNQSNVVEAVHEGDAISIDDGLLSFKVVDIKDGHPVLEAFEDYTVENNKSMNLPGVEFTLPLLNERDLDFIDLAAKEDVSFLALSFVRTAQDMAKVRETAREHGFKGGVIAKIENMHAVRNLDEIIDLSDAIMVARGDLGVEVPMEQIAYLQDTIIQKSRLAGKPVITATQMLQSMVEHPLPTRAEVTDVANAVLDGTDAIMLSQETAAGKYPVRAVEVMEKVAAYNETRNAVQKLNLQSGLNQTESITHAVLDIINHTRDYAIDSVVVFTETGRTVRSLSRYRLDMPIFAITPDPVVQSQLSLSYGVTPLILQSPAAADEHTPVREVIIYLKENNFVEVGHRILFIHGHKWQVPGETNTISIREVL
jgi:pyruvate kinase